MIDIWWRPKLGEKPWWWLGRQWYSPYYMKITFNGDEVIWAEPKISRYRSGVEASYTRTATRAWTLTSWEMEFAFGERRGVRQKRCHYAMCPGDTITLSAAYPKD